MFGSLALNMATGVFLSFMFGTARRSGLGIVLPISPPWSRVWIPVFAYYIAAVVYDIVISVRRYLGNTALVVVIVASVLAAVRIYHDRADMSTDNEMQIAAVVARYRGAACGSSRGKYRLAASTEQ